MRRLISAILIIAQGLIAAAARAQDVPVVVELYTSQGCSSCPPADALMEELAARGDVIALSLHVDYWDYIGWADSFAQPAFGDRQRAYAQAAGEHMVYTPQMIIGGTHHVIGTDAMAVMDAMRAHASLPVAINLDLSRSGATLQITASMAIQGAIADAIPDAVPGAIPGAIPGAMLVQVVRYMPVQSVDIERGENAGRRLTYVNVVTSWQLVGRWDGLAPLTLDTPLTGDGPVVVIVQQEGPGRILAAMRLN